MEGSKSEPGPWLTAERLGAFTDGVIAIIITILVLEIHVPEGHDFARDGILSFLVKLEHDVMVYLLSFALILVYWLLHHVMFHYVARVDRTLIFLNGIFLFLLSLSPFMTELAGTYRGVHVVDTIFGFTYCFSGLAFYFMWRYATRNPHLLKKPMDPRVRRSMDLRVLVAPALSLLGVLMSMVDLRLGRLSFLAIPLFYLSHWLVDSGWRTES